jgi:hypothetical protein
VAREEKADEEHPRDGADGNGPRVKNALARRARYLKRQWEQRRLARPPRDAESPLSIEMDGESRTLLIAFGGMLGRMGMPPLEFFSLAGDIPVKRLFVRDLRQAWYHLGMPGYGTTLTSVSDSLSELISRHEVDRLVVAGNSAGGYAALVFGTLLDADVVLCFAPQTVLDLDALAAIGDHRWDDRLTSLVEQDALDPHWIDLGQALARTGRQRTRYEVYFDESLSMDRRHVERLLGVENLRLYRFGRGSHDVVRALRDSGALARVLRRALQAPVGKLGQFS